MKMKAFFAKVALAALIGTVATFPTFAIGGQDPFTGNRIEVPSGKSFEDVTDAVSKLVAKNGMMVMAEVDQGKMLSMTGLQLKAKLFLIGNPTVGKQLFEQSQGVGLYIPLRVFVYNDANGKTFVSYDKPSSLLSQFDSAEIGMVAKMLDEKLDGLTSMAAK